MNNKTLDQRIATEFMGWEWKMCRHLTYEDWHASGVRIPGDIRGGLCRFSPTTDIRAAYLVLEKIASKGEVEIQGKKLTWSIQFRPYRQYYISSAGASLSLAISKLAESIMDSPTHMELFK